MNNYTSCTRGYLKKRRARARDRRGRFKTRPYSPPPTHGDQMVNIIGHRGAAAEEPENTLRGFKRALDVGAAGVELDVHLTRDGWLAVIHDETLERTTNGRGRVRDFTLAELQKLDAGQGEHIPALEEVVELVQGRGLLLVELKKPDAAPVMLRLCRERRLFEDVLVISFWHPAIKAIKEEEPRVQTGVLMVGW